MPKYVKGQSGNPKIDWRYLPDRPNCLDCPRKARYHTKNKDGTVKSWRNYCTACNKARGQAQYKYRRFKGKMCDACGFIPIHPVQLDVDHLDGDHTNNTPKNIQTLCANCHRLKTINEGEHDGVKYVTYLSNNKVKTNA